MDNHIKEILFYGTHSQQFGHLYIPQNIKENIPVVIVIHGGYWKDNHSLDSYATKSIVDYLLNFDVAVWNLEYRRMNADGENDKAPWPATFQDVANGIDYLRIVSGDFNLNIDNVVMIGHSAGGHLAAWASMRKVISADSELFEIDPLPIKRTLSISGILNLSSSEDVNQPAQIERLMGGSLLTHPECYYACDPYLLDDPNIALTLIHGEKDDCVSVKQAIDFGKKARCEPKVVLLPEADHFSMLPHDGQWNEEHWQLLKTYIKEVISS